MNIAKHVRRIQISLHIVDITSHIIMPAHQLWNLTSTLKRVNIVLEKKEIPSLAGKKHNG